VTKQQAKEQENAAIKQQVNDTIRKHGVEEQRETNKIMIDLTHAAIKLACNNNMKKKLSDAKLENSRQRERLKLWKAKHVAHPIEKKRRNKKRVEYRKVQRKLIG
jgi:hypothetical protein